MISVKISSRCELASFRFPILLDLSELALSFFDVELISRGPQQLRGPTTLPVMSRNLSLPPDKTDSPVPKLRSVPHTLPLSYFHSTSHLLPRFYINFESISHMTHFLYVPMHPRSTLYDFSTCSDCYSLSYAPNYVSCTFYIVCTSW